MHKKILNKIESKRHMSKSAKLNWLRAAVLGANDGIVSIAGLLAGVAGATSDRRTILVAGIAGILAGSLSMAAGEYVSVATQRDAEIMHAKNDQKISQADDDEFTNPWDAAIASSVSFFAGAMIPMLSIIVSTATTRLYALFISVPIALSLNGYFSAKVTKASTHKAIMRMITGGLIAMVGTFLFGRLFNIDA